MAQKKKKKKIVDRPILDSKETPKIINALEQKPYVSFIHFLKSYWKENLILFLACCVIYAQTYSYEYVLDDAIVITGNSYTKKGMSGIADIFTTESFQGYFGEQKDLLPGARYRPLSIASFALENSIVGMSSAAGHIFNVLFYAICCIMLLRFLTLLFRDRSDSRWYLSLAFVGAFLFTLHPLHTEAVANIKGRDEIFVLLFSLISAIYFIKGVESKTILNYILGAVFLFIGLLAKENAITFLAIIPLSQYFFTRANWKQIGAGILILLIPIIAYLMIRYQVIGYFLDSGKMVSDVMNDPFIGMNASQKYATIFHTLGIYLKLGFFPHPLTHDYYPYHIPIKEWSDIGPIIIAILYAILGAIAIFLLRKKHIISYCIIFYLAALSIVSNLFFTVGTFMNERFLFISTIGVCLFIAYVICDIVPHFIKNKSALISSLLFAIFAIGYGTKSMIRVPAWKNPFTLNSTGVAVSKNSARVNTFMCTALFDQAKTIADRDEKRTVLEQSAAYAQKSVSILPDYHSGNKMIAGTAAELYKLDKDLDKLLTAFRQVLIAKPNIGFVYEYFDYLNQTENDQRKLLDFYYEVGFLELSKKQNKHDWALKVLDYGYQLNQRDVKVNSGMSDIYHLLGSLNKAYHHAKMAGKAE